MELNKFKEYIYEGNIEGIIYLLNQNPQYLNSNLGGNRPAGPLHHIAMAAHVSGNKKKRITQLLIDKGATIEIKNDVGATPLLTSVVFNNLDVFCVLMENNANLRATNNNGENCLHAAFTHEGLEIAEEIFSYKSLLYSHIHSLLHQKDSNGRIPVHVNCNRRKVMEMIQENLTLCKKFQEGFCKYRSSCKFLHFHADPPGIFYDNKNNKNNNNNDNNTNSITTTTTTTNTINNNNNNNNNNINNNNNNINNSNTNTTTTATTNNSNNSSNNTNTAKVLCRHYQAGFCKLNNCRFLHISPEVHSDADQIISVIVLFALKQIENAVPTTDILLALAGAIQQVQEYLVRQNMKLKELMIKYKELFKFPTTSPHLCTVNVVPAYSFLKRIHPDIKQKLSAPLVQELEKSLRSQVDNTATKKEDKEDLKRRVFNRTGGYCYLCKPLNPVPLVYENYGQRNKPGSWDFEHIKPKSRFPELDDTDNLLPAHMDCNYKKSYHELESMIGEFDILTIVLDHPSINPKALADLNKYKEVMNNKDQKVPPVRNEERVIQREEQHKAWVVKSDTREIIVEEQKEKIDKRETQKTGNEKQQLGPKDARFWDEHNMNVINYSEITIDKQLGRGTFSDVFRGTWKFEQVAIKKLFDNNDTESFQNEALSIAKNNSSHIVRMVGVSLDPLALVLEYLPGGSLSDLLKNTKEYASVSTSARIQFVIDIAIGLYHIHSRKIIHRDLKPANILLSDDKKHCKLSDFGIAKTTDRTISGSVKGTHLYLAPEAYKYTFNFYTDVYAFGICMHQILTGESPYENELKRLEAKFLAANQDNIYYNTNTAREQAFQHLRPIIEQEEHPLRPVFPSVEMVGNSPLQAFASLASKCWCFIPHDRPTFDYIIPTLLKIKSDFDNKVGILY